MEAILEPSGTHAATADINLISSYDLVEASLTIDSLGTRAVGPWRGFSTLTFNGWGLGGERTAVIIGGAAPNTGELKSFGLAHEQHLGRGGKLLASASRSLSEPAGDLEELEISSRTDVASVGYEHAIAVDRAGASSAAISLSHAHERS